MKNLLIQAMLLIPSIKAFQTHVPRNFVRMSSSDPIGFIGLGIMGEGMASNLLKGGKKLVVWNRSKQKCLDLKQKYKEVEIASSAREVIEKVETTFSMLSTPEASKAVFEGGDGVLKGVSKGKKIVDCATLTVKDMKDMEEKVIGKGGVFMEAPVSGSKVPAANGQLIFLCGGNKDLHAEVEEELGMMGKANFLLGSVGKGTEMKLVANMIMGTMLASLAEGMSLAEGLGLETDELIEILGLGAMANPMFALKGPLMKKGEYSPNFPLKHAQKDVKFALGLGEVCKRPLPVAAAANAEYMKVIEKHGDDDFCAVIEALRQQIK